MLEVLGGFFAVSLQFLSRRGFLLFLSSSPKQPVRCTGLWPCECRSSWRREATSPKSSFLCGPFSVFSGKEPTQSTLPVPVSPSATTVLQSQKCCTNRIARVLFPSSGGSRCHGKTAVDSAGLAVP